MPIINQLPNSFPEDAIFILGAGRFGSRAARVLNSRMEAPIWLIDKNEEALSEAGELHVSRVHMDAIDFLLGHLPVLRPEHTLVPSVPFHLAFEWLRRSCPERIEREGVPEAIIPLVPNPWTGSEGSLLVSYADFLCPEECPEPADHCTVTGEKRETPLYRLLAGIDVPDYRVHVIRSRQMAAGAGGYSVADLLNLMSDLERNPDGKWLLATACRCHGIVTAFCSRAVTLRR